MTLAEGPQHGHEVVGIISLTCHKMTSAHIYPLQRRKQMAERVLESLDYLFKVMRVAFAQGMEMQTFHILGQPVGEVFGTYAETRAGKSRVVEVGLNHGAARIDAQAY